MITPAFDLTQDPDSLIISIRVPYTRTSEFDLYIDGTEFKFYAKPYFLRLNLPGRIVEDGREKAKFDIDQGLFTIHVPKQTPGENFEGLKMLTSLLVPKGSRSAGPLVEDMSRGSEEVGDGEEFDEEFDWQVEQELYRESSEEELRALQKYGFGNQRCGVFARLQEELSDVIDLKNPEGTSVAERRQHRLEAETAAFSADHYLADLFEDDEIKGILKFKPWWAKLRPSTENEAKYDVSFSSEEKEQLRKFTNRSYLLDKTSRHQAWCSLLDILLAYVYDVRLTEGEHSVESPWTIRKLSGTLCWLETYGSLQEVLVSFGRRVLCYPLHRHFALVSAAIQDATKILQAGKACVLKCLLDVHKVFRENDPAYILNDLYITDYCIWIQRVKSKKVPALAAALEKATLNKSDLNLELKELEEAATMVVEEEAQGSSERTSASQRDSSSSEEWDSDDCTEAVEEGNGGGGKASKDSPPQPHSTSSIVPIPHKSSSLLFSEESRNTDAPSSAQEEERTQLIQELGERVAEELRISPEPSSAAAAGGGTSGNHNVGTPLDVNPCRNPLVIVQTEEEVESKEGDSTS
ncbi:protein SHQ1 homolog isoform X2 [Gouania willdenowi]|uniref:protein SHQ1 homolog isoform X2 n=1 Tax=Gouania willdenowi TaxID=441366 RepID=UPI0010569CDF|nr:protein SHQ1 homolog isoform X2 [Gouania willdenowi]